MEQQLGAIITLLNTLIGRSTYDNADSIGNATDYSAKAEGFYLYVGVAGNVTFTTIHGNTMTKFLIAGFYPVKLTAITGATTAATSLIAFY